LEGEEDRGEGKKGTLRRNGTQSTNKSRGFYQSRGPSRAIIIQGNKEGKGRSKKRLAKDCLKEKKKRAIERIGGGPTIDPVTSVTAESFRLERSLGVLSSVGTTRFVHQ